MRDLRDPDELGRTLLHLVAVAREDGADLRLSEVYDRAVALAVIPHYPSEREVRV